MLMLKLHFASHRRRSSGLSLAAVGLAVLTALALAPASARADEFTVSAFVPGPPGSGSYAVQTLIPGFNPTLGTLQQVDVCLHLGYSRTTHGLAVMLDPFVVGAPVGYTVSVGMGATLGSYDATGWVGFQGVSGASTFSGTAFSWGQAVTFDVAGSATNCVTYTDPPKMARFVSPDVSSWYVGMDGVFAAQSVSPANAYFMESGLPTVHGWTVMIDVTFHFTPAGVPVETSSWGAVKSLFR